MVAIMILRNLAVGCTLSALAFGCAPAEGEPLQTEDGLAPAVAGGFVVAGIYVSYEAIAILLSAVIVTHGACTLDRECHARIGRKIGMKLDDVQRVLLAIEAWSEDQMREAGRKANATYRWLTESEHYKCDHDRLLQCMVKCERDATRLVSRVPDPLQRLARECAVKVCYADCATKHCARN
jgi:hypothetical protein